MTELLRQVRERIDRLGLTLGTAARQIGITPSSLQRHLDGAYVRSDSAAKYRSWLDGRKPLAVAAEAVLFPAALRAAEESVPSRTVVDGYLTTQARAGTPYNVVDVFSGCGGMSLGFELFGEQGASTTRNSPTPAFRTVLAIDVEKRVVDLQNENHARFGAANINPARWVDLTQFINPAEVLAYYLNHLCTLSFDLDLSRSLDAMPGMAFSDFRLRIRQIDTKFARQLRQIRATSDFRKAYREVDDAAFVQTSVVGFHDALFLPPTSTAKPTLGPVLWASHDDIANDHEEDREEASPVKLRRFTQIRDDARHQLIRDWDEQVIKLKARTGGKGRGQLASSAKRIAAFLRFLKSEPAAQVRAAWLAWRSERDALRTAAFSEQAASYLRSIYSGERRVDVLLGGPPCQGFSRIGRGKIRSLREDHVHVESDAEAGDLRNLLLLKYVEFVSALEPRVFLFENVRHFQASVKTPEGTFLATDILREAIDDLSHHRLNYVVKDRIVKCSQHCIPQTRERFVMVGLRSDVQVQGVNQDLLAGWCLDLPVSPAVPLNAALEGLPTPFVAKGRRDESDAGGVAGKVVVGRIAHRKRDHVSTFTEWVQQPLPGAPKAEDEYSVDAHHIRDSRADDRAFFNLMGPGRRWMDYRCDDTDTLTKLRQLIDQFRTSIKSMKAAAGRPLPVDENLLELVAERIDGSLSLRLLLESIVPHEGELQHHLLSPTYLAKREGNNGDWIARLDPERPSKTVVSHMAKDTYAYIHPWEPRTISVREAARIQTFPDRFSFGSLGLVDAFRAVGNAVPPLLSYQFAEKICRLLTTVDVHQTGAPESSNGVQPVTPRHSRSLRAHTSR